VPYFVAYQAINKIKFFSSISLFQIVEMSKNDVFFREKIDPARNFF